MKWREKKDIWAGKNRKKEKRDEQIKQRWDEAISKKLCWKMG